MAVLGATLLVGSALTAQATDAGAATAPPSVSHLTALRYDHTISVSWQNPAAVYAPGAGLVVRFARGRTAPPNANVGYEPTLVNGHQATGRPLIANTPYTFAIWVHDGSGHYSRAAVLTAYTRPDVTAPGPLSRPSADGHLPASGTASVTLTWTNPDAPDLAGVRIVRNYADTTVGGSVQATAARGTSFTDHGLASATNYFYFLAEQDTTGHFSRYVVLAVQTPPDSSSIGIAGLVTDVAGNPLKSVHENNDGPPNGSTGMTDSHGVWTAMMTVFPDDPTFYCCLQPSDHIVNGYDTRGNAQGGLSQTGYLGAVGPVLSIGPGEFRSVTQELAAGASVSGTVTGPSGQPVHDALVDLIPDELISAPSALTDSHGRWVVYGLTPTTYTLRATESQSDPNSDPSAPFHYAPTYLGGLRQNYDGTPLGPPVRFALTPTHQAVENLTMLANGRISGTINGTRGEVTLTIVGGKVPGSPTTNAKTTATRTADVAADGTWSLDVPFGDYAVCGYTFTSDGVPYTPGCWDGSGVVDQTGPGLPPGAAGAVHVVGAQETSGIALTLHGP